MKWYRLGTIANALGMRIHGHALVPSVADQGETMTFSELVG